MAEKKIIEKNKILREWKETEIGEIPKDWKIVNIEDLLSDKKNAMAMGPFGSNITKDNFVSNGVPIIRGNNLKSYKFLEEDFVYVTKEKSEKLKASWVERKDLVITHRGTLGQVCIIPENSKYERYIISQSGLKISLDEKKINPYFCYYFLNSRIGQHLLLRNKSQVGVPAIAQPTTSIKKIPIPIPDLETQEKIASILSAFDDKIEINNEMNKTLEEMAQTLFKKWFIDFDFPNENGEPYRSSGGKMVDSELGEIPEGWRIGSLEEVIDKIIDNRGKTPPRTEVGIPLIEGNNIFLNETTPILNSKQKYVSEETYSSWFRAGHPEYLDILCATVGTLPKWCFTPKNTKICIAQNIIAIRSNDLISPYYLKMYIDTENFIKRFEGRIIATAQPSIKVGHLTSLSIIIPIKKVINDFDKIIENIFKKREKNQQEMQSLTEIRDTLLPKLMSGEIEM